MTLKEQKLQGLTELAEIRRTWKGDFKRKSLAVLIHESERLEELLTLCNTHSRFREDMETLQAYLDQIELLEAKVINQGKQECPIAFVRLSYEQAAQVNFWSPEFEPDTAPKGYRTAANFSGIRQGKTFAGHVNNVLWWVPNDQDWPIFEPYTDHLGRKVQVLRRPQWDYYKKTGRMIYENDEPPVQDKKFWLCCVDELAWKTKLEPEIRKLFPRKWINMGKSGPEWNVSDRWFGLKWGNRMDCKLYQSEDASFGGDEVFCTTLDEGIPYSKLKEVRMRSEFMQWNFTSHDPSNIGSVSMVAHKCFRKDAGYELVEPVKFFTNKIADVPEHIMSSEKKETRIKIAQALGKQGEVMMNGGFYSSSPNVLSNFSRERNILPVTTRQIVDAIRGESDSASLEQYPWLEKFKDANVVRGVDFGEVHPTACAWLALLKSNEWVMFDEMEVVSTSITERCKMIIEKSGNERQELRRNLGPRMTDEQRMALMEHASEVMKDDRREKATGESIRRYYEKPVKLHIRKTLGDSKMWKVDPNYPSEKWGNTYSRAGLKMEPASNLLPEQRCGYFNDLLMPDPSYLHLNPLQRTDASPHGCRFYISVSCSQIVMRMESYLWQQISNGERRGEFTGKPALTGDDLIDAVCSGILSKYRWVDMRPIIANRETVAATRYA